MPRYLSAVLLLVTLATPVSAQTVSPAVAELADASAVVLTGRVIGLAVQSEAGAIYTYATVAVGEVLKGDVKADTLVVKQLGGTLPDVGLFIAGQASFARDEEVLLFLGVRPRDGTLYTVGLARGKWQVLPDLQTGGSVALSGEERVEIGPALREAVSVSRPQPEAFVELPPEIQSRASDFTFIPASEGGPARWHEADDGVSIPVDYQTIPGGLPGGGDAQLTSAIAAWNGVNTRLQLQRGFSGPEVCPAQNFTGNGRIALYWNDPCSEIGDGDSTTFGLGGGFFTPGFKKTINGVTFNKFLQGIAILNNVGPHRTTSACLQDAVTHVLGHAIGFGHSTSSSAVMYPTLRPGCSSGSSGLGSDDIDGLRFIYPAIASGGIPPQTPTGLTASAMLDTVTMSWTPATSGGPAQNYEIQASYGDGQPPIATLTTPNATPSLTVGAVPPGSYFVRVRARNVLGTSAYSQGTTVVVGPCTAPGVPSNLAYTTADNLVTLTWTPPATGIAQGYTLYAGYSPADTTFAIPLGPTPVFQAAVPFATYYVRVAARNSCGVGPSTAVLPVSVAPCAGPPAPPTGLAYTVSQGVVRLTWNAPPTGIQPSSYEIQVGSSMGGADLAVLATTSPATTFMASAPPGRYWVRVRGRNQCGGSTVSNEIEVIVP